MHIVEVTWRNRNDFAFKAQCRHCKAISAHGDGYADARYQADVFPDRCCPGCGLNEHGETAEARDARYVAAQESAA